MRQREMVVDLVKVAYIVLIVKVMASSSKIIPWNSTIDDLCIIFVIGVMLAKIWKLRIKLGQAVVILGIVLFVLYSCLVMKQYDLLISTIAICMLIDEDIDDYITLMFQVQVLIILIHIGVSVIITLFGTAEFFKTTTVDRIRFNGGFVHANVLSGYITSCVLMYAWKNWGGISKNQFGWMASAAVFSYVMTKSRTGLVLNIFLLMLILFVQNGNKLIEKVIDPILISICPMATIGVFQLQRGFLIGDRLALFVDKLLTGRIKYAAYAYQRSGIAWMPRYLDYVEWQRVEWTPEWNLNTFTFDNIYSYLFVQMGIVWVAILTVMFVFICKKCDFKVKLFFLIWALYGMVEVHGFNCFKFFPLILLTIFINEKGGEKDAEQNY